jgi:hypothetical protein
VAGEPTYGSEAVEARGLTWTLSSTEAPPQGGASF